MANPWFRLYSEAVDDEKLRLLAFEDRWHYIAILCCKNNGVLDEVQPNLMRRKVAVKLGLDLRELGEVARRLSEVGLVDQETLQPLAWDKRQFRSDTSKERTKAYRDRMKSHRDVTVTAQEADTEEDTDSESESDLKTHTIKPVCDFTPTPAGLCCKAIIQQGIKSTNQYNPLFIALLEAGATEQEFANAAKAAVSKGKPDFAYVLGIVKKQREDAAKLVLHRGPLPTKQESLDQENKEATQRAKARLFGMQTEKDITNETTRL